MPLRTKSGRARAIRCALGIQSAVSGLGLEVRAGLHTGEVERPRGAPPRGIAVHVASRVASLAGAGEVLVTATTRDLLAGSGLAFDDRGEFELKGLGEARRVYVALGRGRSESSPLAAKDGSQEGREPI